MAPAYKLTYFNVTALGEPIRLLFTYGGIEFEDVRIEGDGTWAKIKPTTIMGQVPILEHDGKVYHQSVAIARMVAKKVKLTGANEWEDLEIDAMVDTINDFRQKIGRWHYEANEDAKASSKDTLFNETIPMYLKKLEEFAKKNNGHLACGKLTWADIYFVGVIGYMNHMAGMDLKANQPNLTKVWNNVLAIASIKKWVDNRPNTP